MLHLPSRLQGSCICGSHLLRVTHGGVSTRPSWTHQPGAHQDPRHGPNTAAIRPGLRMEAPQAGNGLGGFYSRNAESERDPKVICCLHPAPFNNRESGLQEPRRDESGLCPSTPAWLLAGQKSTPRCSCAQTCTHRPSLARPLTEWGSVLCLQPQEEPWRRPRAGAGWGTVASCSSGAASQVIHR